MPAERQVRFLRGVEAEMNTAADEYDDARPELGDEFLAQIQRAMRLVIDGPHRWPRVDRRHHRLVVHRFPYSVYYRFDEVEIVVVAIAHNRRRPDYWIRRR